MKVISLYQPWATLIAIGAKKIETRSWSTKHRGRLGIHASAERKYIDMRSKHYVCDKEPFYSILMKHYTNLNEPGAIPLPRGAIIAICDLQDCIKIEEGLLLKRQERLFGDYTPGRFRWMLGEDVIQLEKPIIVQGKQGLWDF